MEDPDVVPFFGPVPVALLLAMGRRKSEGGRKAHDFIQARHQTTHSTEMRNHVPPSCAGYTRRPSYGRVRFARRSNGDA
jgi:hypothetical protein